MEAKDKKNKNEAIEMTLNFIVSILAFIGLIGVITGISALFSKEPQRTEIIIDNDAFLEVCGEQLFLNEYIDGGELEYVWLSGDINETCDEYIRDNLREEIEEEVREELEGN